MNIHMIRIVWDDRRAPAFMTNEEFFGRYQGQSVYGVEFEDRMEYDESVYAHYRNFEVLIRPGRPCLIMVNKQILTKREGLLESLDFVDEYLRHFSYQSTLQHGDHISAVCAWQYRSEKKKYERRTYYQSYRRELEYRDEDFASYIV